MREFFQICWVVPDLESAAKQWVGQGVGPFVLCETSFPEAIYRGRREPLEIRVGMAQAGPMQIELIQQVSDGPSAFRDAFGPGESGWHHVAKIVPDYQAELAALRARNIVIATEAEFGGHPFCYADTRHELGVMVELVPDTVVIRDLLEKVTSAALNWDGRTPIIPLA